MNGSCGLDMCAVAAGRLDAYFTCTGLRRPPITFFPFLFFLFFLSFFFVFPICFIPSHIGLHDIGVCSWDFVGPSVIVQEAGGLVLDPYGIYSQTIKYKYVCIYIYIHTHTRALIYFFFLLRWVCSGGALSLTGTRVIAANSDTLAQSISTFIQERNLPTDIGQPPTTK